VKELAYPVLGHRIIVSPASRVRGVTSQQVVEECLGRLVVPGVRARRP
jgi:MoxR-like ATPase